VTSLGLILGASLLTIVPMLLVAGLVLALPRRYRDRAQPALLSYAAGTLMGAALLGLLPHALAEITAPVVLGIVAGALTLFFGLERMMVWRHCHAGGCDVHSAARPLILLGDGLHNFVDGIVLAAAFLTALPLGVSTLVAVIAHELPQELGDFAILLDGGYPPVRALALNTLSSLTTPVGAALAWAILQAVEGIVPILLAVAASSFLYVAGADLLPALVRRTSARGMVMHVAFILAGFTTASLTD
jgi:zinc and cadmium transporter